AEFLRRVADLLGFQDSSRRREIRMNDVDRVRATQLDELLFQVDVFAGENRDVDRVGDLLEKVRVGPWHHVLEPRKVVLLEPLSETDAAIDANMAEMIGTKRDVHAD